MENRVDLDIIGVLEGSEKSSSVRAANDYLRHYESLFTPFRQLPINVFEIGMRRGSALRVWQWYFSQATIVCLDADPAQATLDGGRVKIRTGNRTDRDFLDSVCAEFPPTLVIDAGAHNPNNVIATFKAVFPRVTPHGIYVIEGLEPKHAAPAAAQDLAEFVFDLARSNSARRPGVKHTGPARDVDAIALLGGAAAITRRAGPRDLPRALATADAYLTAQRRDSGALERLAAYVLRHGGSLSRAEAAIDAAIENEGISLTRLLLRADILLAQSRAAEAVEVLRQAAALPDAGASARHRLARLQVTAGDHAGALASAAEAVRLDGANATFRRTLEQLQGV